MDSSQHARSGSKMVSARGEPEEILSLSVEELEEKVKELEFEAYRGRQIFEVVKEEEV